MEGDNIYKKEKIKIELVGFLVVLMLIITAGPLTAKKTEISTLPYESESVSSSTFCPPECYPYCAGLYDIGSDAYKDCIDDCCGDGDVIIPEVLDIPSCRSVLVNP